MKPTAVNITVPTILTAPPSGLTARKMLGMSLAFRNNADVAELLVYGEVGRGDEGGVTPNGVAKLLRDNRKKPITVKINSPGGYAWDGIGIMNALLHHDARVTVMVEGVAGSAASIIAMAGNPIRMFPNSTMYVHRASATVIGNRKTMAEALEWLDQLDDLIAQTYASRSGRPKAEMLKLMDGRFDGSTLTAAEAKAKGLADEIITVAPKQPAKTARAPLTASTAAFRRRLRMARSGLKW